MKLSRLEKRLLKFIDKHFPAQWEEADAKKILTKEEKPLATEADFTAEMPTVGAADAIAAATRLCALGFVKKVYLYAAGDFTTIALAPGHSSRTPLAKSGGGTDGYQVTKAGKDALAELPGAKIKKVLKRWGEKFAEEYVPLVLVFLLGLLVSSLFGFDLRSLRQSPPPAHSETQK